MINELIAKRYSPKFFSARKIDNQILIDLFEAARWAPSSRNEQPWKFILGVKNENLSYEKILNTLMIQNKQWAQSAPVLIMAIAKHKFDYKDSLNNHAFHDVGFAVANLTLQATANNLYLHQMGGFNAQAAKDSFQIPEGFDPVSVIAVGYIDHQENSKNIEEPLRNRKEISEMVFEEKFGKSSQLVSNVYLMESE